MAKDRVCCLNGDKADIHTLCTKYVPFTEEMEAKLEVTISISTQYAYPLHSSFEVVMDGKHMMCGNQEVHMKANAIVMCLSIQRVVQIYQRVHV